MSKRRQCAMTGLAASRTIKIGMDVDPHSWVKEMPVCEAYFRFTENNRDKMRSQEERARRFFYLNELDQLCPVERMVWEQLKNDTKKLIEPELAKMQAEEEERYSLIADLAKDIRILRLDDEEIED